MNDLLQKLVILIPARNRARILATKLGELKRAGFDAVNFMFGFEQALFSMIEHHPVR